MTKEGKTQLFDYIKHYCYQHNLKHKVLAYDCGMTERQLYRIMNGEIQTIKPYYLQKLADYFGLSPSKIVALINSKYETIKIKHLTDETKQKKSFAGKLCWNPRTEAWEHQLVLYNDLLSPPSYQHPVWDLMLNFPSPQRAGLKDWEAFHYFRFTLE